MSLNPGSRGVLGRIVVVCGAITAGTGALILVGWAIGREALTAVGTGYVPMPPNTALLFVLLGSAVLVREAWPASRIIHRIATAAAVFSAVVGSVTLIGLVIGLNIDDSLFSTMRMLGDVPMGHMSPVTAFCFVLAGASLLLLECQAGAWAAISGTLITLAGAVCLMGYGFGAPLLYGGTVIPVALPTSLALVALGIGLTAAAGPHAWPLNILIGPSTCARLLRALLPTVVLLALINSWITAVLLEHSDPGVVLASALTAVSFLLVVGFAVSRVSRAIGDAIDRTEAELTHAVEALHQSEARYRELFGGIKSSVVVYTAWQNGEDFVITDINPAGEQLEKITKQEVVGRRVTEVFSGVVEFGLLDVFRRVWKTGQPEHHPVSFYHDNRITAWRENYVYRLASGEVVAVYDDVTERKRADDALRESEARFRAIASHTPDHIVMQDRDLRYSFVVNPQLGLTEADMIGKTDRDFLGKEDAEKLTAIKRKVLETGESVQLETSLRNPKGETEFFEGAYISKFDSTGKADGLIGYFRNITARKQAEDALTHSRDLMRYIIEHNRSAITVHDRDLKYVYVSQRYLQEYKVKERDVIGKHHYDVFPDLPQKWRDIHQKALAGEISSADDDPYVREDGTVDWTRWECRPWYDADGSIGGIIIYTEIITERKRAEEALQRSERLLKNAEATAHIGYYEIDVHAGKAVWSEETFRIFGLDPSGGEPTVESYRAFVHPDDVAIVFQRLDDSIEDQSPFDLTYRIVRSSGEIRYVHSIGKVSTNPASAVTSIFGTLQDITKSKHAEQVLHEYARRLRSVSRRLIAVEETERRKINRELHDRVGASLSALNLNLSIVRSQLPRESLRAVGARLDDTQRLLEETTAHVRDVMADLHPPALDDYGLLAALRTYVESLGARFAVPISVHGKPFIPRLPLAAETALFRVAQGALVNAVTHAQAKRIEILLVASADRVALTIADNGVGFDVTHASLAHASWGLAIMRERAEAVGAELTVESTPGKGTRVCVEISREKR